MSPIEEATLRRGIGISTPADVPVHSPDVSIPHLQRAEPTRAMLVLKRAIDLVSATLLLIVLAPLLIAIAIAVKLDSPGPILFRQRRVGRNGEVFHMWKFRTMIRDADAHKLQLLHLNEAADGLFKIREDPRVTRFGRLLRSTSLDELPQLLHLLSGRMSLVGPRPLVEEEDALVRGPYRCRLDVRPGITGIWQVSGGPEIPISEMAALDRDYVLNWTLGDDARVILGTARLVLRRAGI